jgi:hypothetical protein
VSNLPNRLKRLEPTIDEQLDDLEKILTRLFPLKRPVRRSLGLQFAQVFADAGKERGPHAPVDDS